MCRVVYSLQPYVALYGYANWKNAYLILSRKPENKMSFQKPTSISEIIKTYFEEGREAVNWVDVT